MDKSNEIASALQKVHDQSSFIRELLSGALEWPIPEGVDRLDDLGYDWTADDLRTQGLEKRIVEGKAFQIRLAHDQTWGVFLLEFHNPGVLTTGRGLTGALRRVLRGLVASRSRRADLPAFARANLLFICTDKSFTHYRFAYFKTPPEGTKTAPLATFGFGPDEPARTACEFNLPELVWPGNSATPAEWTAKWARAFDVEKVTRAFFEQYSRVFKEVEVAIQGINAKDRLRLYTQQLFNRLMFIAFIQKKGWLKIEGAEPSQYLSGLWRHYLNRKAKADGNFSEMEQFAGQRCTATMEGIKIPKGCKNHFPLTCGCCRFWKGKVTRKRRREYGYRTCPAFAFLPKATRPVFLGFLGN